jgi:hypothetical protein
VTTLLLGLLLVAYAASMQRDAADPYMHRKSLRTGVRSWKGLSTATEPCCYSCSVFSLQHIDYPVPLGLEPSLRLILEQRIHCVSSHVIQEVLVETRLQTDDLEKDSQQRSPPSYLEKLRRPLLVLLLWV